jgi:integrase
MRRPKLGSIYQRTRKQPDGSAIAMPTWWIKYYRGGQPFRESSHSDNYAEAERLLKRRQGEIVTGRFAGLGVERICIEELLDDVVEEYRLNRRKSLVHLNSRLKNHVRPAFGNIRAAELSTSHIRKYVAKRLSDGAANATVNRELEIVERAYRLASECEPPKVVRLIHIPMLTEEDNVRSGFLDDAGYVRLRQELPDHLRAIFVVAYHVGNRVGELRRLLWTQVDFANDQILLNPGTTKNMKGRVLPIYGDMRDLLLMEKEIRDTKFPGCRYVFHHDGRPIVDYRKAWASACQAAGAPGLLFHDLRRSAIRNMRLAGVPENVAMEISGHRTRSVFDRYSIVGGRDIRDAGEKMAERLKSSLGTPPRTGTLSGTPAKEANNREDVQGYQTGSNLLN